MYRFEVVFTLLKHLRFFLIVPLLGIAAGLTAIASVPQIADVVTAVDFSSEEITMEQLDDLGTRTLIYDANGELVSALYTENRELLLLEDIPVEVVKTILVIEDEGFYDHHGISLRSILRAARENVGAGGISQGGSTITQQLIKNLLLGNEQTFDRKVNEAIYAWRLEKTATKDEILQRYLNTVFFGQNAYGLQAAAEVYWGKDIRDLGWLEAATLAPLISSPTAFNPILFPEEARRQREIVLKRLLETENITEEEFQQFNRQPLPTFQHDLEVAPENYFIEEVRKRLLADFRLGETQEERDAAVGSGGLRVYTTFDPAIQQMAEAARDEILPVDERFEMAMASIEPATGAVKAIVGGPGFDEVKFDLTTSYPGRQPGSSFKPFVMVTLFENGFQPNDTASGVGPCTFDLPGAQDYEGNNFGKSDGKIDTIQGLTTSSSNCGYLRLGQIAGLENVIQVARSMGITSPLEPVLSLPLGAKETRPIDMAAAYSVIANQGVRIEPYFIERIENSKGEILFKTENIGQQVIKERSACWATQVLAANVRYGTGTAAGLPNQVAAGKTGTTEEFSDAWFVGFTPYLATAVWMGNPDARVPMLGVGGLGSVTGGSFPARAWGAFNRRYHESLEPVAFPSCDPYPRAGRFLRLAGDPEIDDPCGDGGLAIDVDKDGEPDRCVPDDEGDIVYEECGYDLETVTKEGAAIPVYCEVEHIECLDGFTGVDTTGDQRRDTCEPVEEIECPDGFEPVDSTGDGVGDECQVVSEPTPDPTPVPTAVPPVPTATPVPPVPTATPVP